MWNSCSLQKQTNLKTTVDDGNGKRFEHGERRDAAGCLGAKRCGKKIVEVAETHKPLFAGELFLTGKKVCERLYISPRTLQDYRDRKIIPYTQFAGKILYKTSDLEKLLEENYKG